MSELSIPGGQSRPVRAPDVENVVVGQEIVRHKRSSRLIHWTVAVSFGLAALTGMPIWSPIFGWMAYLFGGLQVCRWLHPWVALVFVASSLVMLVHWAREMVMRGKDKEWLSLAKMMRYLNQSGGHDEDVPKYNGGQKLFFWGSVLGALGLLISGIVIWFPLAFAQPLRELAYVIHDITFIVFAVALVGHIYLGTAAGPGTFMAMTRGTVTKDWARTHHPGWYREVTGQQRRR